MMRVIRHNWFLVTAMVVIAGFLLFPVTVNQCGTNGFHVGFPVDSGCGGVMPMQSLTHAQDMTSLLSLFVVSVVMVAFAAVYASFWQRIHVLVVALEQHSTIRRGEQGILSYHTHMNPHNRFMFILSKIYGKTLYVRG